MKKLASISRLLKHVVLSSIVCSLCVFTNVSLAKSCHKNSTCQKWSGNSKAYCSSLTKGVAGFCQNPGKLKTN